MTFNEVILREEQENEHLNWIATDVMIRATIGFKIFCALMHVKAYTVALVIQVALIVIGTLAGIPLQIERKKRLNS